MADTIATNNLNRTTQRIVAWYIFLFSLSALCTCITASFVNATWEDMLWPKRILTGIAIIGNWTTVLMAFLSKAYARMETGKPILDSTDVSVSEDTTTTTKTHTEAPSTKVVQ